MDAATTQHDNRRNGVPSVGGHPVNGSAHNHAASDANGTDRGAADLKAIPETRALRDAILAACRRLLDRVKPQPSFGKDDLEQLGRQVLADLGQPDRFLGFAMVVLGNLHWRQQFVATPFERRLLLLPVVPHHAASCTSDRPLPSDAANCGACLVAGYQARAEELGYQVLATAASPIVLKSIVEGHVDGILGIAGLNDLEKAVDRVLLTGVPAYAVPLLSDDGREIALDESWVADVLDVYEPLPEVAATSYLPLMRAATHLFNGRFESLLPRGRSRTSKEAHSPLGRTEDVAYDWLANGGKRFRPFITLAAYEAATGGLSPDGPVAGETQVEVSDSVARVAMAIEAFHKASLVHDDIQDDDLFRYGRETLHRTEGLGPAINIGDYLIGIGYRLVNSCRSDLGADVACDILDSMAAAHIKLCDGQGAEMAWQHAPDWEMSPLDALQIYALKTSPAFEAALFAGLRMGGDVRDYAELIPQFSRHLGIGFQVLNDLKDWQGDADNKLVAGQDALALRPTVLLALALDGATNSQQQEIREIYETTGDDQQRFTRLYQLFVEAGAFEKAEAIVEKSRDRAESLAASVSSKPVRRLLRFLVDTVLTPETPLPTQGDPVQRLAEHAVGAR